MTSKGPDEIKLEPGDVLTEESVEIARIWITNGAGSSVWIAANGLEDPYMFGCLMADTIRHAAVAYAGTWSLDEGEALQAIVNGVSDELRDQFTKIETVQHGSLN
ncbi:DUF5076 domain-containing protein [Sphingopyxis sp. H115]|uniref:DUF5076 domain-containing protein n=1 Tax=Sphingopyxis sp. H115 TaxID=1759073 RepID=UPI0007368C29|nr:DUF5076 domain-containing protein [Sphingopyxis sp. H115]KTE03386.1 hypothetical protein ATE71_19670 [Sphingopyxis sp. H115]